MAIASHFFVAAPEDAARNDGLEGASADRLAVFYRVMDIGIRPIFHAITGRDCPKFTPVAMKDDYSQITFKFPEEFVSALAGIHQEQYDAVITEWRTTDDVPYNNESDLRNLLDALVRLARCATDSGLNMYLWNCL